MENLKNKYSFESSKSYLRQVTSLGVKTDPSFKISELAVDIISKTPKSQEALSFDHCPFSQEELRKGSLLESLPLTKAPLDGNLTVASMLRWAANTVNDGLASGGKGPLRLDGVNPKENFIFWERKASSSYST